MQYTSIAMLTLISSSNSSECFLVSKGKIARPTAVWTCKLSSLTCGIKLIVQIPKCAVHATTFSLAKAKILPYAAKVTDG